MENIIIPKNEKQLSVIKAFLKEVKIHFRTEKKTITLMTEEEFYAKIDHSIKQAKEGKVKRIKEEDLKAFLGL